MLSKHALIMDSTVVLLNDIYFRAAFDFWAFHCRQRYSYRWTGWAIKTFYPYKYCNYNYKFILPFPTVNIYFEVLYVVFGAEVSSNKLHLPE